MSYNGSEVRVYIYEVLTGTEISWIDTKNGDIPPRALVMGNLRNGEAVYMGRAHYLGSVTPGKVVKSQGRMYISHSGTEHSFVEYEVLAGTQPSIRKPFL